MIVTLTLNPSIDASSATKQVVAEHKLRCRSPRFEPGGGGINVSNALCRLGKSSMALITAGGVFGEHLKDLLRPFKFSSFAIPIAEPTRENLIVLEESTNLQYRFNMPGPKLSQEECQAVLDHLAGPDCPMNYLVASGTLPEGVPNDFYRRIADIAWKKQARFILDTSGDELKATIGHGIHLLKINLREFHELIGGDYEDEQNLEQDTRAFIEKGSAEILVVSLAAGGAIVATKDEFHRVYAPTVRVKSKVGAGDSMVGGLVYALSDNRPVDEVLRMGVAAGTAAVMAHGTELCRKDDAFQLFERLKA